MENKTNQYIFLHSKIRIAYDRMEKSKAQGNGPEKAANLSGIELTQAADVILIKIFIFLDR